MTERRSRALYGPKKVKIWNTFKVKDWNARDSRVFQVELYKGWRQLNVALYSDNRIMISWIPWLGFLSDSSTRASAGDISVNSDESGVCTIEVWGTQCCNKSTREDLWGGLLEIKCRIKPGYESWFRGLEMHFCDSF